MQESLISHESADMSHTENVFNIIGKHVDIYIAVRDAVCKVFSNMSIDIVTLDKSELQYFGIKNYNYCWVPKMAL